jgi:hypothetical protein
MVSKIAMPALTEPPGGVDVERDVLVGVFAFQEQQLRHHQVGRLVIDRAHQEDHALLEQARIDVVRTLAAARLLDDHGHHAQTLNVHCAHALLRVLMLAISLL